MAKPDVVVTFAAGERQRAALSSTLGGSTELQFLPDLEEDGRREALANADVLLAWNLPRELPAEELRLLGKLRLLQLISAGADHLPFAELPAKTIVAANIGAYAAPMAEHILAMTLALMKNLLPNHAKLGRGEFNQKTLSRSLQGSVCGILGYGAIGRATARLLRPFGAKVLGINRSAQSEEAADFLGTLADLDQVLRASHVLIIALPLNKATHNLIGKPQLQCMKPNAILINVARADIVDEAALYEHLKTHPDFLAGIDAWWIEPFKYGEFRMNYPFLELPNVLGSPHNSAMTPGTSVEAAGRAAQNILQFLRGEAVAGIVLPEDYS